jgi:hypothetical protein
VLRLPGHPQPVFSARGIHFTFAVKEQEGERWLVMEPARFFDHQKLTPELTSELLKQVDPILEDAVKVEGEFSMELKKFRVPLILSKEKRRAEEELEGTLGLHRVTTEVKGPLLQALVKVIADLHHKEPTEVVRVVNDSTVRFAIREGRMHHEGLTFGFPDISPDLVVRSSGSVGFDETLDLHIELPRLLPKEKAAELGTPTEPVQVHITGTVSEPILSVRNSTLAVRLPGQKEAILGVNGVDLNFRVVKEEKGRWLVLKPVRFFDRQKLTPKLCDEILARFDPALAGVAGVEGEFSLDLEQFRIPLDVPPEELAKKVEVAGSLRLHRVTTEVKTPLLQSMVKVLADLYGKKPSEVIRVVNDATIAFAVREGRMHHEGLVFGFPDISPDLVVRSSGSVGLDKSLDLRLEVPKILLNKDVPQPKGKGPVKFHITGVIGKPIVTPIP